VASTAAGSEQTTDHSAGTTAAAPPSTVLRQRRSTATVEEFVLQAFELVAQLSNCLGHGRQTRPTSAAGSAAAATTTCSPTATSSFDNDLARQRKSCLLCLPLQHQHPQD
jgi:hypothetical protein